MLNVFVCCECCFRCGGRGCRNVFVLLNEGEEDAESVRWMGTLYLYGTSAAMTHVFELCIHRIR